MFNSKITWGDELTIALRRAGGLQPVAKQLREALGFLAPSRATLAKLQKIEQPEMLTEEEAFRAWLVLVAIGEDPAQWQLLPIAVPGVFDVDRYQKLMEMHRQEFRSVETAVRREGLEPPTRCFGAIANVIGIRRKRKPKIVPDYDDHSPHTRPIAA